MKAVDSERTYINHHGEENVLCELSIFEDDGSRLGEKSKKALLQAVLGAVEYENVGMQEGQNLAGYIVKDSYHPTVNFSDARREDFIRISSDNGLEYFARKRREAIFSKAAIAQVGVSVLYDELSVDTPGIEWYDKNGVSSDNIDGVITPSIFTQPDVVAEISDMSGSDSNAAKLAMQNPDYVNSFCFVINPKKVNKEHLQLINIEGEGVYTPFVTVLSEDYHDSNIEEFNQDPSIAES